jgi:hypothetical protein
MCGVVFEVGSRRLILRILVATNATGTNFAFGGGAGKEVGGPTIVVLEKDVRFEKGVDG